jgi:hypothetical protein
MKTKLVLIFSVLVLLLSGCASAAAPTQVMEKSTGGGAPMVPAAPPSFAPGNTSSDSQSNYSGASSKNQGIERIVIKNAELSIVVIDPGAAMTQIANMAEGMGGFVVSSQLYKTQTTNGVEVPVADITVRVPAEKLSEALEQIKSLVIDRKTDIVSENISGQDVTKEYTDLQSRLTNLQNTQKQLQQIMDSATKTEDVLAVYNQLTQVQEQIEVAKGQIKYYDESSKLSSIHVGLKSKESVSPLTIGGWQPVGVARDALQTLLDTIKILANILIWAVIFCLPISILVGVPGWFIFKGFRKWYTRRKQNKTLPKVEEAQK